MMYVAFTRHLMQPICSVERIMLMQFILTHYALPICSKLCLNYSPSLPTLLKLSPCIISGSSKLVCSNNYFMLYRKVNWNRMAVYRPLNSVNADHCSLALSVTNEAWDETLHGLGLGHSLRRRLPVYRHMLKMHLLFLHNAQCFLVLIIPQIMPA